MTAQGDRWVVIGKGYQGFVDIVQQRQIEQWIFSEWAGGAKPMVLILSHSEAKSETMPYP